MSLRVQTQYDDNPYPRWVNMKYPLIPVSLQTSLKTLGVKVPNEDIFSRDSLDVLVAGCGTGSQPLMLAKTIKNTKIDAIDLSIASLCYAKRKVVEFGVENITLQQQDILNLDSSSKI